MGKVTNKSMVYSWAAPWIDFVRQIRGDFETKMIHNCSYCRHLDDFFALHQNADEPKDLLVDFNALQEDAGSTMEGEIDNKLTF